MVRPSPIMKILPSILLLVATFTSAEDQLPVQRPVSQYTKVWEACPFNREVVKAVEEGRLYEIFGCGTAALITPVCQFTFKDEVYEVPIEQDAGVEKLRSGWIGC